MTTTPTHARKVTMKADVDDAPVTSPVVEGAKSPESGARSPGSTRSHDPFGAFPLPQLEVAPPAFGQPHGRRASSVSFGMTGAPTSEGAQEGRGSISPPAGASLQPSPHSHTSHATKNNVYRASRDAFYHHFELDPKSPADASPPLSARGPASPSHHNGIVRDASGNAAEVVRCHQLGVVSLALSYLLADLEQTKGKFPNLRVTHEDIITSLKLPLSYLSNSHLTFHELFAIVTKFVELDERFADFEARAITFDTKRADINAVATLVEEETGRRSSALTTTELRSTISDDGLSFQRIKIACFDAETIAAENVIELDDGDKGDNLLTHVLPEGVRTVGEHDGVREARRRPGTHSGCGIIADINRSKNLIQLLTAVSVEPLKVRRTGVPLKTFHDALSVRNPYSNRAQGIIEVLKKGTSADKSQEGTLNISIGLGSDQLTKVLATTAPDTYVPPSSVFNAFGWDWPSRVAWTGPVKVPVEYHDYTVANHLLTTATALHLLNRTKFPQIDINGLVSTLKLSASQVLLGRTMHCQQWFSMMQHVAGVHNFAIDYLPFTRHLKKPGSPPFLSMEALSQLLSLTIRNTASSPDSEMTTNVIAIASFNGNKARQSLNYVAPGDNPISYVIIAGFDEEAQLVLLVDCDTKRNELHWVSTLDNFYAGLTDHGLLLLGDGPEAADVIKGIIPDLDEFTASARAAVQKYIPIDTSSLGAAGGDNTLACGTPLSLCALAASRLGSALRLDDLLEDLPCNISHALFPHMSIFDLARLFNTLSSKRGLEIIATPFSLSLDRAMHRKVSLTAFASKLKSLLEEGQQVVVYYSRFLILQAPTAAVESVQLPNYALVLRVLENDIVVLADTNPSPECSVFQVSMMELFKACEDGCQVSRRPKGWVSFAKDAAAMATYRLAQSNGLGALHLKAFSTHPFRPTGSPQLQALAMAFTALGHVTPSSDIFFKVLELGKDDAAAWLLPLSGIRRRLTVETLVKIGQVYASKVLEDAVVVEVPTGSSRGGQLTRDDVSTLLKSRTLDDAKKEEPAVVKSVEVCIYNVRDAYDVPLEFVSAGVVIGFDAATEEVVIADAEPSSWGEYFRGSVSTVTDTILHEPDDKDYASFGLISVSRKKIL